MAKNILDLTYQAEAIPADDPRRVAASIAMFDRLAEHWALRGNERETLLGGVSKSTWSEWKQRPKAARVKRDTRERIADLFTIDLNAHTLFGPEFADRWIREPNAAFNGESPLATMLRGRVEDVIMVRRYLEHIRTSSPMDPHSEGAVASGEAAVSYLTEAEMRTENVALASLRRNVAIFEEMASTDPVRYRRALASALSALALSLGESNDVEALLIQRRAVNIRRQTASEDDQYAVELLDGLVQLERLLVAFGEAVEARSVSREASKLIKGRAFRKRDTA